MTTVLLFDNRSISANVTDPHLAELVFALKYVWKIPRGIIFDAGHADHCQCNSGWAFDFPGASKGTADFSAGRRNNDRPFGVMGL